MEQASSRGLGDERIGVGGGRSILDGGDSLGENALLASDELVDFPFDVALPQGVKHSLGRGFFEYSVGLIGAFAPPNYSTRRVRRLRREAVEFEASAIGRREMPGNVSDHDGVVGGRAVENIPCGVGAFFQQAVVIPPSQDDFAGGNRIFLNGGREDCDDIVVVSHGAGWRRGNVHHIDHGGVRGEVAMPVDKARH